MPAACEDLLTDLLSHRDFAESVLSLINSNLDAVITIDQQGTVIAWNMAAEDMFGYKFKEAIDQPLSDLIIPKSHTVVPGKSLAQFAFDQDSRILGKRLELEARTKCNSSIIVEMQIARVDLNGTSFFTALIRDITEQRMFELRSKMLIDELNHRVKNTLTAVSAVARQSAKGSSCMGEFMSKFEGRVQALANTHQLLTTADQQGIGLRDIFMSELQPYEGNIRLDGDHVYIPGVSTLTVSMCIHELVTNAIKYGALSCDKGCLRISWMISDESLVIRWNETDGPPIHEPPTRKGFGTSLLRLSMADLKGSYRIDYAESGLFAELRIPKARIVSHQ